VGNIEYLQRLACCLRNRNPIALLTWRAGAMAAKSLSSGGEHKMRMHVMRYAVIILDSVLFGPAAHT
jgi:hypothetical protein